MNKEIIVHPEWIQLEKQIGRVPTAAPSLEGIHACAAQVRELVRPFILPATQAEQAVASYDKRVENTSIRIYKPASSGPYTQQTPESLPVLVFFHGGALLLGSLDASDRTCRKLCTVHRAVVVSVDYPLGPANKWPNILSNSVNVTQWILDNTSTFNGDPSKVITIGESAGGTLALCIANELVRQPGTHPKLRGVAAGVPSIVHPRNIPEKYRHAHTSFIDNISGRPFLSTAVMEMALDAIDADPDDQSQFMLLSEHLEKFPKVYLWCCELDPLRDDAKCLAEALREHDVEQRLEEWKGLPHEFWNFQQLKVAEQYREKKAQGVNWLLADCKEYRPNVM